MYSPITPSTISWMPPMNVVTTTIDVQPGTW